MSLYNYETTLNEKSEDETSITNELLMNNLQVDWLCELWQVHFSELSFLNFFNHDPVRFHSHRRFAL
jgi:hypothetical protein